MRLWQAPGERVDESDFAFFAESGLADADLVGPLCARAAGIATNVTAAATVEPATTRASIPVKRAIGSVILTPRQ